MSALAGVAVGDVLPVREVPLTRTVIVATAIASRDYQDVHHDPDLARRRGSEDIFMNILSSNGFAERLLREWAGPGARLTSLRLRLGVPNYPGDVMRCTGTVTAVHGRLVEVALELQNSRGAHATGTATLEF